MLLKTKAAFDTGQRNAASASCEHAGLNANDARKPAPAFTCSSTKQPTSFCLLPHWPILRSFYRIAIGLDAGSSIEKGRLWPPTGHLFLYRECPLSGVKRT